MKRSFDQALAMLEAQGKPSIFRLLMKPVSPTLNLMIDVPALKPRESTIPEPQKSIEEQNPEPVLVPPTPPSTPETPKPVVFITPPPYEFHTVVVLKKWWTTLSCKQCTTAEQVGFPVNP